MPPVNPDTRTPGSGRSRDRWYLTLFVIVSLFALTIVAWHTTLRAEKEHRLAKKEALTKVTFEILPSEKPSAFSHGFSPVRVALPPDSPPVYLYVSPTTKRYLVSVGGDYELLLKPWRTLLEQRKAPYTETTHLKAVPRNEKTVLILPSSIALSEKERQQLMAFQQAGGNILATNATGAVDEDGKWAGDDFLRQLFGISITGQVKAESEARFLNLFGETPLTGGYPAGLRIWLEGTAEQALHFEGSNAAATYMDWIRSPKSASEGAAVLYGENDSDRKHARWVAIGFSESSWGRQASELSGLMENALHWLSRGTSVTKAAWPIPYQAAYLIEMDTEEGFGSAYYLAEMMNEIDAKATFYCLTSEALRYPHLVRHLSKQHEIAYHGDVHIGFGGQPVSMQKERLERMQADMHSILEGKIKPTGFRAPEENYDKTTEALLQAQGFRHHAADPNRTDARLPFIVTDKNISPEEALIVLPRTQHDDIGLRVGRIDREKIDVLKTLLDDFDNVLRMGGLGIFSVHSQYFSKNSLLHTIFPAVLQHANRHRERVWIAPANEITEWWRERERLHHRVSGNSDRFILNIEVKGDRPLTHGAVIVTHRNADAPLTVEIEQGETAPPKVEKLDTFRSALIFENLKPGAYRYSVTPVRLTEH